MSSIKTSKERDNQSLKPTAGAYSDFHQIHRRGDSRGSVGR